MNEDHDARPTSGTGLAEQLAFASRDEVVKMPHDFIMNLHVGIQFGIPKVVFGQTGLVHHYTDSSGLLGIISTSRLWASNSVFLNDPTEGTHALRVAQEAMAQRPVRNAREADLIRSISAGLDKPSDIDLYVVSFCRKGDLLSQWRGYGAFGAGYAVGFDLATLAPPPQVARLIEVTYDDEILRSAVHYILDIYIEHLDHCGWQHAEDVVDWSRATLNSLAQGFKHPAYSEEREVRLLCSRYGSYERQEKEQRTYEVPIMYRARGANIVSYLDLPLAFADQAEGTKLPIREVVIGPGASLEQNKRSLEGLLSSHGYANVRIVGSQIPFRR